MRTGLVFIVLALGGCGTAAPATVPPITTTPAHCHTSGSGLMVIPDPACTPGQWIDTDAKGVCSRGYNPRPPLASTSVLKRKGLKEYGLPANAGATTESDHLFPVWLGGATTLANLWPEQNYPGRARSGGYEHNPKDRLEFALYRKVCQSHTMTALAARAIFEGDWRVAYPHYP